MGTLYAVFVHQLFCAPCAECVQSVSSRRRCCLDLFPWIMGCRSAEHKQRMPGTCAPPDPPDSTTLRPFGRGPPSPEMAPAAQGTCSLELAWSLLDAQLCATAALWNVEPFKHVADDGHQWTHEHHRTALELTDAEAATAAIDEAALEAWIPELRDIRRIAESIVVRAGATPVGPPCGGGRAATGVPGRKLEQIAAFASHVPRTETVVDWCSGKGHLARWLAQCGRCRAVRCLERDPALVRAGRGLAAALPIEFAEVDVLASAEPLPVHFRDGAAELTHTALHACGDLHRQALRCAASTGALRVVLAPCCYHKHKPPDGCSSAYRPLSAAASAGSRLLPLLSRSALHFVTAATVIAGRRCVALREREQQLRLAFDVWQRRVRGGGGGGGVPYLSAPSAPESLLRRGTFREFCEFIVGAPGHTSELRAELRPALDRLTDAEAEECMSRGEELRHCVTRLELVRRGFRRPLELWFVLDLCLFLREQGYAVEVRILCDPSVTPRNLLVWAERVL